MRPDFTTTQSPYRWEPNSLARPETGQVQGLVDVPVIAPNATTVGPHLVWALDYHGALTPIALR